MENAHDQDPEAVAVAHASLPDDVRLVVADIQRAFRALLEALPRRVKTAAELRRVLSVDNKLASQVFKIAHADDPVHAAVLVPGTPSFDRLILAATAIGLGEKALAPALDAMGRFEKVVRRHAGNRTSFDSMLTGLAGPEQESLDLQHRRAAFRAMGHILGVQAQILAYCSILYPVASGNFGLITLRGLVKLRRMRSDTPVILSIAHLIGPGAPASASRRPIDDDRGDGNPAGFVTSLCPNPLPRVRTRSLADGGRITELVEGGIGDLHANDFVIGFDYPEFGKYHLSKPDDPEGLLFTGDVQMPAEDLIHDVLIHKTIPSLQATSHVYPNRGGIRPMYDAEQSEPLPTTVSSEVIENAAAAIEHATPEVYAVAVRTIMDRYMGKLEDYRLYRCRLRFPVVNTIVRARLYGKR